MLRPTKRLAMVVGSDAMLSGIKLEAWVYTLGNRSALEWILDQYKEKPPRGRSLS